MKQKHLLWLIVALVGVYVLTQTPFFGNPFYRPKVGP